MTTQNTTPDRPVDASMREAPSVEDIARAYFEHGPDGYPGRYDQVSDHIKARNRPRFEAIAALWIADQ